MTRDPTDLQVREDAQRLASLRSSHTKNALRQIPRRVATWGLSGFAGGTVLLWFVLLMEGHWELRKWLVACLSGAAFGAAVGVNALFYQLLQAARASKKDIRVLRERRAIVSASEVRGAIAVADSKISGDLTITEDRAGGLSEPR